ncbi:hypothetical protein CsatB_023797 [Cannabis sativa]
MDSGNSGSMQSSSGGDEEYDSRAESISALLSTNPQGHMGSHHAPQQQHTQHHQQSSMFDPLSNFFDPTTVSSRSPLNLDMAWPRTLRSDPNSIDLGSGLMSSSSAQNQSHPFFTNSQYGQGQNRGSGFGISGVGGGVGLAGGVGGGGGVGLGSSHTFQGIQIPLENNNSNNNNGPRGTNPGAISGTSAQNDGNNNVVRNPKKRSRASRRAPTTVLTTDTTNFRAMVQEFTGIPAPPFTSSPFPRSTRLDLFGTGGGAGSSMMRSGRLDSPPPYILRPFAQKVQAPQQHPTTSFIPPISSSSSASMASTSTAINYQQPPPGGGSGSGNGGQNPLLMQNPVVNFHSLLQAQPKFSLSKPQTLGPLDHQISHHGLEDFGLSHHGLSGLPNLMSSDHLPPRSDGNHPTTTSSPPTTTATPNWGDEVGMGLNDTNNNNNRSGNDNNNNNNVDHHHHHLLMRSINGGPTTSNSNGRGPENVTTRTEGMVESWICSSD